MGASLTISTPLASLADAVAAVSSLPARAPRLALVNAPFASALKPSMQVGLLSACAADCDVDVTSVYANVELAAVLGLDLYEEICGSRRYLLGEWLFGVAAFGDRAPADPQVESEWQAAWRRSAVGRRLELDRLRRDLLPTFLDQLVATRDWSSYDVVGFTSTFQQNVASLALARRLKTAHPGLTIVFGGANCEGPMGRELLRSFDAVDHVISGYADISLPALVRTVAAGDPAEVVPGVRSRSSADRSVTASPSVPTLDALPVPDYAPYFAALDAARLLPQGPRRSVPIPYESSRGCWWGERRHCTFCGLNGDEMTFRSKSSERLVDEIYSLVRSTGSYHLEAVDNILDERYIADVLPRLVAETSGITLFYEVKSSLGLEQLRRMRAAGVLRVQPGIESLSSRVLGLMRKGVTAARNVHFLTSCRRLGIDVEWNILWGFPGEHDQDYEEQISQIGHLVHLQPPHSAGPVWLERYSPLFADRSSGPARTGLRPRRDYAAVYPSEVDLDEMAYFFELDVGTDVSEDVYARLATAVDDWSTRWSARPQPRLTMWRTPDVIHIEDTRVEGRPTTYVYEGPTAFVVSMCEVPVTVREVAQALDCGAHLGEVELILRTLADQGILFRDGPRYVLLAVPAEPSLAPSAPPVAPAAEQRR